MLGVGAFETAEIAQKMELHPSDESWDLLHELLKELDCQFDLLRVELREFVKS